MRLSFRILLALSTTLIALATLTPTGGPQGGGLSGCIWVCGSRGLSDAIANILLFVPFGWALGGVLRRRWHGLVAGALLSIGIELAQVALVAGRDSSTSDVVSNALGAWLGAALGMRWRAWIWPDDVRATRLFLAGTVAFLLIVAGTGWLFRPAFADGEYARVEGGIRGGYLPFSGQMLRVTLGDAELAAERAVPGGLGAILEGDTLRAVAVAGVPRRGRMRLFRIEREGKTMLASAWDGDDLLLHYHARSSEQMLDSPAVRLSGALATIRQGDRFTVEVWKGATGLCATVIGPDPGRVVRGCPELTPASGWSLLQAMDSYPPGARRLFDLLWMAGLTFVLGLWFRPGAATWAALAAGVAGVWILPSLVGLQAITPWGILGIAAGWLSGWCLRSGPALPRTGRFARSSPAALPATSSTDR